MCQRSGNKQPLKKLSINKLNCRGPFIINNTDYLLISLVAYSYYKTSLVIVNECSIKTLSLYLELSEAHNSQMITLAERRVGVLGLYGTRTHFLWGHLSGNHYSLVTN